jgi:hypothetical protein
MTPYEAWYKRKPVVHHMRTFGCLVHVKIINGHVKKLEDRSTAMVFFGYEKGSKAYRAYNPVTKKVMVTRDVVFEEDKPWTWPANDEQVNETDEAIFRVPPDMQIDNDEITTEENVEGYNQNGEESGDGMAFTDGHDDDSSASSEGNRRSQHTPVRLRSLADIYNETETVSYLGVCMMGVEEPTSFDEADKEEKWRLAMKEEIESINCNHTWSLVEP